MENMRRALTEFGLELSVDATAARGHNLEEHLESLWHRSQHDDYDDDDDDDDETEQDSHSEPRRADEGGGDCEST
ncbi:unnamed protein product [Caenorhabditis auriculariae]|uniref:Uncharacterized protein n=1 Tax=Caenorhabditis auriculariae TaxID=2777116 RepID=A0A8S1HHP2_9PELO|nr:unnamed protein product [Caenorhabditis auriculariae]